jgi:hypothetical protein
MQQIILRIGYAILWMMEPYWCIIDTTIWSITLVSSITLLEMSFKLLVMSFMMIIVQASLIVVTYYYHLQSKSVFDSDHWTLISVGDYQLISNKLECLTPLSTYCQLISNLLLRIAYTRNRRAITPGHYKPPSL